MQMQESTGFQRTLSGQYSANVGAWLISSAWAHRWWAAYLTAPSEVLFPGILAIVLGIWGAAIALSIPDRRTPVERSSNDRRTIVERDVAWYYVGLAIFTFWLTLGPKAGLYTLLYYTVPVFSFLRAPSRAGIVVTLCLVVLAAPALIVLMRRRAVNTAFAILLRAGRRRFVSSSAADARSAAIAGTSIGRSPRCPRRRSSSCRTGRPASSITATRSTCWRRPLTGSRSINGYSDHIPQDFRDHAPALARFPSRESFAILEPLGARYAVFHLDLMTANDRDDLIRRLDVEYARLPAAAREGRRRVALRNRQLAALAFFVGDGGAALVAARQRPGRAWHGSTITTPSSIPGSWRGSRTSCRAIR